MGVRSPHLPFCRLFSHGHERPFCFIHDINNSVEPTSSGLKHSGCGLQALGNSNRAQSLSRADTSLLLAAHNIALCLSLRKTVNTICTSLLPSPNKIFNTQNDHDSKMSPCLLTVLLPASSPVLGACLNSCRHAQHSDLSSSTRFCVSLSVSTVVGSSAVCRKGTCGDDR